MSPKQLRFCQEYIIDLNGTQAAIRAGYSAKTAGVCASKYLKIPCVKAKIEELQAAMADKLGITAERVLNEIARLAFHDPRKFFDSDGRLRPITELDDDTAMALAGCETLHKIVGESKDGCLVLTKIKIADKGSNLERLGRHLKLFTDKLEVSDDRLSADLQAARERVIKNRQK